MLETIKVAVLPASWLTWELRLARVAYMAQLPKAVIRSTTLDCLRRDQLVSFLRGHTPIARILSYTARWVAQIAIVVHVLDWV